MGFLTGQNVLRAAEREQGLGRGEICFGVGYSLGKTLEESNCPLE